MKRVEKGLLRARILENPDFQNPEKWRVAKVFFCVKCDSPALISQEDRCVWGCCQCDVVRVSSLGNSFYQKRIFPGDD